MAGNVEYMNGAQLISALGAANQAVSGMSYAEAAAALGGSAEALAGGDNICTFPLKYTEYGQVTIEAQYAAQLWEYWKTVAGAEGTTVLGAAAGAAVNWARGALIGTGGGTLAATAGILTVSVPTAVALATPLLGVGLGVALYESNPELWTKISNACVDFVNEGTQTISALITEAGQVLLPKGLVDSIKNLFEEEGIGGDGSESASIDSSLITISQPVPINKEISYRAFNNIHTFSCTNGYIVLIDKGSYYQPTYITTSSEDLKYDGSIYTSGSSHSGRTLVNNTYYSGRSTSDVILKNNSNYELLTGAVYSDSNPPIQQLATVIFDGTIHQGGEYPTGTSKWSGKEVDPEVIGTWPAYDPNFGTTQPYVPVSPKSIGSTPGTTTDPQDPTVDPTAPLTQPEIPIIDPWISPVIAPEIQWPQTEEVPVPDPVELTNPIAKSDPVYLPEPALDPATDPAAEPEPLPDPATEYPGNDGRPPQSGGNSPPIIFPIPDPETGVITFPTISPTASQTPVVSGEPGFVQVYHPSPAELLAFGRWLWVTYADATIDKIWNNPFDGVIGCHELYTTPTDGGYTTIRCGFLDSGVSAQLVRLRYSTINCGSMIIPEYWGNYLDYSPYAKAYIYLPFIGIQEIDVDDVVGHAVNVCYHIDAYNGSCIAQITCAKDDYTNTLYQFSGNCAVEYPLSGGSQAAIKAAMMTGDAYQAAANTAANATLMGGIGSGLASAVGGIAGGVATGLTGNIGGGIGQAIGGIASGVGQAISGYASSVGQRAYGQAQHTANMLSGKSVVQHSGCFGASYGAMGIKKPYIFLRRPIQKVINNYNILYGYPAHKQVIIGNCTGFLRCREVHVVSPLATDNEKTLIEQLLTSGVYVTDEFSQLNS